MLAEQFVISKNTQGGVILLDPINDMKISDPKLKVRLILNIISNI